MRWVIAALGVLFVYYLIYGGAKNVMKQLRQGFTWRVPVMCFASLLTLYAYVGFFAAMLAAMGGFEWAGSFEWPVGYARQTFQMSDGRVVVIQDTVHRVQVYDSNLHFLHGWGTSDTTWFIPTDTGGVEIHERARGSLRENVYTPDHQLVLQYDWPSFRAMPLNPEATGTGRYIPTPWWLWPYRNPGYACLCCLPAILLFALADPKGWKDQWAPASRRT